MISIASRARFRQRVIRYAEKHGVTDASIRHRVSRKAIYEWKAKYDGHWKSLMDKSHRPHSHASEHTEEEYNLIERYYRRNKEDMIVLWDKLCQKGIAVATKVCCVLLKGWGYAKHRKSAKDTNQSLTKERSIRVRKYR